MTWLIIGGIVLVLFLLWLFLTISFKGLDLDFDEEPLYWTDVFDKDNFNIN